MDYKFLEQLPNDLDFLAAIEKTVKGKNIRLNFKSMYLDYLIEPPYAKVIFNGQSFVVSTTGSQFSVDDALDYLHWLEAAAYLAMHLNGALIEAQERFAASQV